MSGLLSGVLPVFLLIALGYALRKTDFLPDETWRPIEKLSINILYPGFLVPAIWAAVSYSFVPIISRKADSTSG